MKSMIQKSWARSLGLVGVALVLMIGPAIAQPDPTKDDPGLKPATPTQPDTSVPDKILPPKEGIPAPPDTIGKGRDEPQSDKPNDRPDRGIRPPANGDQERRPAPPLPDRGAF